MFEAVVLGLLHLAAAAAAAGMLPPAATVMPASNTYIANTSLSNVTYMCQLAVDSPEDTYVLWALNNDQIKTTDQQMVYENSSVFIEPLEGSTSTLTVTPDGRMFLGQDLRLTCYAKTRGNVGATKGTDYFIVQYDPPGKVGGLELTYHSEQELRLQWSRPGDFPSDVLITYHINITNTSSGAVTQSYETTETYVLVSQTGEGECQPHIFSVTASNDAGTSPASTIMESIPISPDVNAISRSQRVDQVLLGGDGTSVNINVSFQAAIVCNEQFPVLSYSVAVEGLEGSLLVNVSDNTTAITVTLSRVDFPDFTVDQQYRVVINACTEFTCRRPPNPLIATTTDVQSASVVFFENNIMLECVFAVDSSATGCLFVFTRLSGELAENVTVLYDGTQGGLYNTSCDQLSQTRGAYDEEVLVYAVQSDGSTDSQPLTASVLVETEPDNFTCPLEDTSTTDKGSEDDGLNTGAIAGIVIVGAGLLLLLAVVSICFICYIRHKINTLTLSNEVPGRVKGDGENSPRDNQQGGQDSHQYELIGTIDIAKFPKVKVYKTVLETLLDKAITLDKPLDIFVKLPKSDKESSTSL